MLFTALGFVLVLSTDFCLLFWLFLFTALGIVLVLSTDLNRLRGGGGGGVTALGFY